MAAIRQSGCNLGGHIELLVAADQEGGQLIGLGDGTTPFAGAMALGATGDEALADRVARATALELRALGVNVDYAPVCDLADNPARRRLEALREWVGRHGQPPLDVVGCADHQALAAEVARRSITLVRNDDGLLPLKPAADARIAVVQSMPADLTPADTSSTVVPTLAAALGRRSARVEEILLPAVPVVADISGIDERLRPFDLVVVGTLAAHMQPAQAALAAAVLATGKPTVTVALRTPWDLLAYPSARTHICSYGNLPPSMEALAAAMFGEAPFEGRLPVAIAGHHPHGHGLTTWG